MRRRLPWVIWAVAIVLEVVILSLGLTNRSIQEDPFFLTVALMMIAGYTTIGALIASRTTGQPQRLAPHGRWDRIPTGRSHG